MLQHSVRQIFALLNSFVRVQYMPRVHSGVRPDLLLIFWADAGVAKQEGRFFF